MPLGAGAQGVDVVPDDPDGTSARLVPSEVQLSADEDTVLRPGDDSPAVSLLVAGDLSVAARMSLPNDSQPTPWATLEPAIRAHDIALVNLECPLTATAAVIEKSGPALRGDPALAGLIARGGFTGVTLANNHILDAGESGLRATIEACRAAGLSTVGAGPDLSSATRPMTAVQRTIGLVVIACAEREFSIAGPSAAGAAPLDPWTTPALVRESAEAADAVVVVVHGGNEGLDVPRPGLVAACRALVAAGASAVICHHAHVAGPVEIYRHAPIFYGTGNFLFPTAHATSLAWRTGYAVSLRLVSGAVASFALLPYEQDLRGPGVHPMAGDQRRQFLTGIAQAGLVLLDPDGLDAAWRRHCRRLRGHYLSTALGLTRAERLVARYVPWPTWRRPRPRIPELLDLFTCESHREAVETILSEELRR